MIKLHTSSTFNSIKWEEKKDGTYVKDYFASILEGGASSFVSNLQTEVYLLELDTVVIPITVNNAEFENSYVCSPFTHYVSYAKEELWELKQPILEKLLLPFINLMGFWLKKNEINKVVIVNNWFLSTNLYHHLTEKQLEEITLLLTNHFPEHVLMFRSLNKRLHPKMFESYFKLGYKDIFSRSIYLYYPERIQQLTRKEKKDIKNDLRLLKKTNYEIIDNDSITDDEISIIANLYNQLYIDKYSNKNPMFTPSFYKNAIENELLQFRAIKKGNKLEGILGYFVRNGVATAPIFGYDMNQERSVGLYRLLSIVFLMECQEKELILHASAGAGQFKRNRGAEQELEYSFVYYRHLSKKRQFLWKTLRFILKNIVESMAKKYRF